MGDLRHWGRHWENKRREGQLFILASLEGGALSLRTRFSTCALLCARLLICAVVRCARTQHYNIHLQLVATARLNRSIGLLIHHALPALIAMPPQSTKSLAQDRVAEVVRSVHPVGVHGAQVLDLQLDERLSQLTAVSEFLRELVGLELVAPGEDVHQQLDHGVHGGEGVGEEDEADDDGHFGVEAEGAVEGLVVDEDGEEGEDVEEVDLRGRIVNMCSTCNQIVFCEACLPVKSRIDGSCDQGSSDRARVREQPRPPRSRSSR